MTYLTASTALPDPVAQPEFYRGILTKRAIAWVVDVALITGMTILAGILTLSLAFFLWPVAFIAIGALYRIGTLAGGSATWGMRLMGIELRGPSGERFDGMQSMLHVMGYYACMSFVLPALASIAAMFVTGRHQGLTDLVLGSTALNRPS